MTSPSEAPKTPRTPLDLGATIHFLALRLIRGAGDNGVSSDALIAAAATGSRVPETTHPHDLGDLARCFEAFDRAPYCLKRRMLPQLAAWTSMLSQREAERA